MNLCRNMSKNNYYFLHLNQKIPVEVVLCTLNTYLINEVDVVSGCTESTVSRSRLL